jgi:hypothetical protein
MANLTFKGAMSKGQDGGPPTPLTAKVQCTKSYVGGNLIGTVGDQFELHVIPIIPPIPHPPSLRQITAGASKTYFEGNLAARINDPLMDGDAVAEGNAKTNVE